MGLFIRRNGQVELRSGYNDSLSTSTIYNPCPGSSLVFPGLNHVPELILDTTPAQGKLQAYVDGILLDLNGAGAGTVFPYAANPVINFTGLSWQANSSVGAVRNFLLVTPELGRTVLWLTRLAAAAFPCNGRGLKGASSQVTFLQVQWRRHGDPHRYGRSGLTPKFFVHPVIQGLFRQVLWVWVFRVCQASGAISQYGCLFVKFTKYSLRQRVGWVLFAAVVVPLAAK